jgi:hypothetical protein
MRNSRGLPSRQHPYYFAWIACEVGFSVNCSARPGIRLDAQLVVDSVHYSLAGTEVPFRGLYRPVSKQELNLLSDLSVTVGVSEAIFSSLSSIFRGRICDT